MLADIETVVIGAGVAGLACARALAMSGRDVMVLERHGLIGSETSARNSEVIHAGIYYPQGSLKARLCVAGKQMLYAFCRENGIGHEQVGKLIVATDESQLGKLAGIREKAAANGVTDLEFHDASRLKGTEPALFSAGALWSPSTGIVDGHGLMLALQGHLEACDGQVVFHSEIQRVEAADGRFRLLVKTDGNDAYPLTCKELVVSAGHGTPGLMSGLPGVNPPKPHLVKGSYFKLAGKAPFSTLVYPVPEPGGLGIHLTLDLQHQARFGPDVEPVDRFGYEVDPARARAFYTAIRKYWPDLEDGALVPDYAGIRPKIAAASEPPADFRIDGPEAHGIAGLVALYGIESPGLTASLAIGEEVAGRLTP